MEKEQEEEDFIWLYNLLKGCLRRNLSIVQCDRSKFSFFGFIWITKSDIEANEQRIGLCCGWMLMDILSVTFIFIFFIFLFFFLIYLWLRCGNLVNHEKSKAWFRHDILQFPGWAHYLNQTNQFQPSAYINFTFNNLHFTKKRTLS